MKVILQQDVNNLGEEGDVVAVADGYGRNYLLPRKLAVMHSTSNLALLAARRKGIEKRKEQKRQDALSLKQRLENEELVINMNAGANGKLFGSVTSATIMEALEKVGLSIEKKRIEVPENTIKTTGNFTVRVRLYGNEDADLTVSVRSESKAGEVTGEAKKAPSPTSSEAESAAAPVAAAAPAEPSAAAVAPVAEEVAPNPTSATGNDSSEAEEVDETTEDMEEKE